MPTPINVVTESDEPGTTRGGSSFTLVKNGRATGEPVCNPDGVHGLRDIDFVEQVREPRSFDPVHRHELIREKMATWRQIFLDGLTRQICLARDPNFRDPRQQFVESDGVKRREIVYVAPESWWFEQDGTVFLRLNFGERNWCVTGKNPVIRIGAMDELLPTLEKLHILIGTGEFDEIIEKMVIVSER
jgi:hypothetical protein